MQLGAQAGATPLRLLSSTSSPTCFFGDLNWAPKRGQPHCDCYPLRSGFSSPLFLIGRPSGGNPTATFYRRRLLRRGSQPIGRPSGGNPTATPTVSVRPPRPSRRSALGAQAGATPLRLERNIVGFDSLIYIGRPSGGNPTATRSYRSAPGGIARRLGAQAGATPLRLAVVWRESPEFRLFQR